jgi:hypothetical protein
MCATAEFREHAAPLNPKDFLRERYGFRITTQSLARVVAAAQEHGLQPSPELKRALARVLSQL